MKLYFELIFIRIIQVQDFNFSIVLISPIYPMEICTIPLIKCHIYQDLVSYLFYDCIDETLHHQ